MNNNNEFQNEQKLNGKRNRKYYIKCNSDMKRNKRKTKA